MAYEKQIEDFAESKAIWVSHNKLPLLSSEQMVRGWKKVTDENKAANEAYLNAYVSPKNAAPSTTITDPQADGSGTNADGSLKNVHTGLWRHVSTAWSTEQNMYLQTLRLGWAPTLLTAGQPNDECMIQQAVDSPKDPRALGIYWRNIAETAVNACMNELRAAVSFTNPSIQGETKTGLYVIGNITPKQDDDGSYTILVETVKATTVTSIADVAAMTPSKKLYTHDVENPFGVLGQYTAANIGRKPRDGIVYQYRAITSQSLAVLRALTDAELLTLLGAPDQTAYKTVQRKIEDDAAGTLQLAIAWQWIPLATSITAETARYVGVERKNQSGKIILTIAWPRIDPRNIDTVMASSLFVRDTATDPVVEGKTYLGDYLVNTTMAPMTNEDAIVVTQRMTKAGDQKLDLVTGEDPDHCVYEFFRWDISALDVAHFMAESDDELYAHGGPAAWNWGTPENGKTKNVKVTKNEDESFTLYAVFSDTTNLTKLELFTGAVPGKLIIQDTHVASTERAFGWNIPVIVLKDYSDYYGPDHKEVNQRNKFTISRRTEHVFDFEGVKETFVEVDSGDITVLDDETKTVVRREGSFLLDATMLTSYSMGASVPGVLVELSVKNNDVGTHDAVKVTTTVKDQVNVSSEEDAAKTATKTEHTAADTAEALPAQVDGTTVTVVNDERPDGKVHTVVNSTVVKDQVNVSSEEDAAKTATKTEHTAAATAEELPAQVDGTTVVVINDERPDGKIHTVVNSTVAKDQENVSYEEDASKKATKTEHTAAAAAASLPAPVVGTTTTVINDERPDGKVHTVVNSVDVKDQTDTDESETLLEVKSTEKHTAAVDEVTADAAAVNVESVATNAANPDGTHRTAKQTSTLQAWDSDAYVPVAKDGVFTVEKKIAKNQATAPSATADGEEVDLKDNGRGAYDAVMIKRVLDSGLDSLVVVDFDSHCEWQPRNFTVKVPSWSTSTNSDVLSRITGWNIYDKIVSRSRTITVKRETKYSLDKPDTLPTTGAGVVAEPDGANDGAGTSYHFVVTQIEGGWKTLKETATTSPWNEWILGDRLWVEWIEVREASGEA